MEGVACTIDKLQTCIRASPHPFRMTSTLQYLYSEIIFLTQQRNTSQRSTSVITGKPTLLLSTAS